jgi:hypothetical protein
VIGLTEVQGYVIIGLLAVGVIVLLMQLARSRSNRADVAAAREIDQAIERLGEATQHHVQVNAVLALTEQFQQRPELINRLGEYSRQVVAAAIMTRINGIANDIKVVQGVLSQNEKSVANGYAGHTSIKRNKAKLAELQADLEAMNTLAQQFAPLRAV